MSIKDGPLFWEDLILNKAIQFLARRSHSEMELRQKLWHAFSKKNHIHDTACRPILSPNELRKKIEQAIEHCRRNCWLNEKEFAESYYSMRQCSGYGHQRILLELKARGISSDIIDCFSSKNEERQENILAIAEYVKRKYGSINIMDLKQKNAFIGFF